MSAATSSRSSATSSRSPSAMVRERRRKDVRAKAEAAAEERVLNALVGATAQPSTRESFRTKLRAGQLDDKEIEVDVADTASPLGGFDIPGQPGSSIGMVNLGDLLSKSFGGRTKRVRTTVKEAYKPLVAGRIRQASGQ